LQCIVGVMLVPNYGKDLLSGGLSVPLAELNKGLVVTHWASCTRS
jgi:hypothetical protein